MKEEFNLGSVLEHVANGKTPVGKAKSVIEKHFSKFEKQPSKGPTKFEKGASRSVGAQKQDSCSEGSKVKLKNAFNKLKKSVSLEEFFKRSSQFVHHISDQISESIPQKFQENFSPIGFSVKSDGVGAKLSVFRAVQVSAENIIEENLVVGCQWFGVRILDKCEVKQNKFTAMQLTEFSLSRSDLCDSVFSLSRMSHVTMQEACFVKNKISLSTLSDASITESDFNENTLSRSDFSGTVINCSRLSKLNLVNVNFKDCEFDTCDIQGFSFDNCEFKDCSFSQISAVATKPLKISGCRFVGKQFSNCQTAEELVELLKG